MTNLKIVKASNGDSHLKIGLREYVVGFLLIIASVVAVRMGEVALHAAEIDNLKAGLDRNTVKAELNQADIGDLKVEQGVLQTKVDAIHDRQERVIEILDKVDEKIDKLVED